MRPRKRSDTSKGGRREGRKEGATESGEKEGRRDPGKLLRL